MQQSNLLVRGFEPMRQINASHLGAPDILGDRGATLVGSARDSSNGFSLQEAVTMVATLEELMRDSESSLLETAYTGQRKSLTKSLDLDEISKVVEDYFVHWMLDGDEQTIQVLLQNRTLLESAFPKWHSVNEFIQGTVKSMELERQRAPQKGHAEAALAGRYSFNDAHQVVGDFTRRFGSFWESECQLIKESLVALDTTGTGRIRLSDFYGANSDGEWRFGESEAYLRELGALDESSSWLGKQVIIPNYLQGASNCIVATQHYLVCCANECESILNDVEEAVGASVAQPEEILSLVSNMTGLDDVPPKLSNTLRTQMLRIAETHGGSVPLHGRLFAQWLHYVFPRECPFPHRTGMHTAMTPSQYGDNFIASDEEVNRHAVGRNESASDSLLGEHVEAQLMSQWSEEEELIADYSRNQLRLRGAPWASGRVGLASLVVLALILFLGASSKGSGAKPAAPFCDYGWQSKEHYV
jgi:hypothetical protein